jgi:flagellar assembly protein FliH
MSAPTKFLFDNDFARGDSRPTATTITLAEHALRLAEAETAAHRRGIAEAQTDTRIKIDRSIAEALERIAAGIAAAGEALHAIETRLECEAVDVAVAVARKLAPALIEREPFAEISALASNCFRQIVSAPHVAVRVNDALYATARDKLEDIVRATSFEGRLVVLAEPTIAVGDCRIEWADGGINRDTAAADATISEAVSRYVSARRHFAAAQDMLRRSDNE